MAISNSSNINRYCTFYIVRHAETEWNVRRLIQGQGDSPLTLKGKEQAKELAKELRNITFDKIFSSDLLRAKRTAEIIALEHKLLVETTKLLRERMYGPFEGKQIESLKEFDKVFEALTEKEKFSYKIHKEVESDEEMVTRLITFLRELALGNPAKTILISTHGSLIRAFLFHIGFGTYETLKHSPIPNASYLKLLSDGVEFFIKETKGIKANI